MGYRSCQWSEAQDLPISGKRVYLHILKRMYRCPRDRKIHTEEIPWLKRWARVTRRFAEQVGRLTAITTNQEAGWFLGLDEVVYRIHQLKEYLPAAKVKSLRDYLRCYRTLTETGANNIKKSQLIELVFQENHYKLAKSYNVTGLKQRLITPGNEISLWSGAGYTI